MTQRATLFRDETAIPMPLLARHDWVRDCSKCPINGLDCLLACINGLYVALDLSALVTTMFLELPPMGHDLLVCVRVPHTWY